MNIQFPSATGIQGFVYWLLSQIMSWGWVSYGVAIIFFTLFIKLILAPLDFANRFLTRRTQIKQQALAGELADLQQTYGNDPLAFARARQALYQKNGVGGLGSSLVALASIIITMVIFFTLFIKLILAPLDFANRFLTRRTQIKQQALAGELADLQQTYGNDPLAFARARQALYQKNGVGGLGSSLVALASIIITMVIFFQVMGALNNISNYNIRAQYQELQGVYAEYKENHTEEELTAALNEKYQATKIGAGWIKNIWQPDNPFSKPIMSVDDYNKNQPQQYRLTTDEQKAEYNAIFERIHTEKQNNGFFLLAIISAVTIFLSMKINAIITKRNAPQKPVEKKAEPIITYSLRDAKQQNNGQEQPMVDPAQMSKIMMWTMPLIYVWFATMQTSAFAIYMIASSVVSTLLTVGFAFLIDFILRHTKQPEIKKDFDAKIINPHAKYFKGGRK